MQRTDIGLYMGASIGLSVFGVGHTLTTFQAVGKKFLSMQLLIILTINECGDISDYWFYIANRDPSSPVEQSFFI